MDNFWLGILLGVIGFMWGFSFYHSTLTEDAQTGGLLKLDGKIYKLVEQKVETSNGDSKNP